ncbi:aldo/keto reductase [Lentzea aerocolonigenes]|uniref:Aldo/keto reductase n=1 Tax=Lentzea aerocolonigenes TaxID=68170 RepID=A0A0F0H1Y5_LENAE|nr:oxidoreductase [Lentzea aerocolonigenes]KJK48871.1 aldo/keto reductase [Lentzea aerocolonigenes]
MTWRLGDLTVNRIGFGAMRLPQLGAAFGQNSTPRDRTRAIEVLREAVRLGVNHIDTAAFYFSRTRSANELINSALSPYPGDLVIVTKVGPSRSPQGEWLPLATPHQLRGQVEENLRQLGKDHLDVVNLRTSGLDDVTEHFEQLAALQQEGLIRHLGLSNVKKHHLDQAQRVAPVVCVQNSYGLGHHPEQDDFLGVCGERGIAFVPFFALAGANKEAGTSAEDDEVSEIAARHDASPAQVRLAWTLARGPHVLVIPGTGDLAHLRQNVEAGALQLTPEELTRLDALHLDES